MDTECKHCQRVWLVIFFVPDIVECEGDQYGKDDTVLECLCDDHIQIKNNGSDAADGRPQ